MPRNPRKISRARAKKKKSEADGEMQVEPSTSQTPAIPKPQVWRPGVDDIDEGEELEFDPSAYDCLHNFRLSWPCLSFDVVRDTLGDQRSEFPHFSFLIAGTQAEKATDNSVAVIRLSNITKIKQRKKKSAMDSDDSDSESSEEEGEDEDMVDGFSPSSRKPIMQARMVSHYGGINRLRSMNQSSHICSSWSDSGHVQVWDFSAQIKSIMQNDSEMESKNKNRNQFSTVKQSPLQIFTGHKDEGFAMDWSPVKEGRLLTGDCKSNIYLWEPQNGGKWAIESDPFVGHTASVEDIQWSPTEADVFASCSVDQHLSIWDVRSKSKPAISIKAHDTDVNVISWNRLASCMIASGSDDGTFCIWDLRSFKEDSFIAHFKYHSSPITSIEWSYYDSSTLALSSSDNQLTVWDLSLERDAEEEAQFIAQAGDSKQAEPPKDIPPQLLFVHQGQKDIKEMHWHPQINGLLFSTALEGFNVFRPSNL